MGKIKSFNDCLKPGGAVFVILSESSASTFQHILMTINLNYIYMPLSIFRLYLLFYPSVCYIPLYYLRIFFEYMWSLSDFSYVALLLYCIWYLGWLSWFNKLLYGYVWQLHIIVFLKRVNIVNDFHAHIYISFASHLYAIHSDITVFVWLTHTHTHTLILNFT